MDNLKTITIQTTNDYIKVYVKQIKYINIENRSICYHLIDGVNIESQKLRTSFNNSIGNNVKNCKDLIYLKPALVFNLEQIQSIDRYKVVFNDGEEYYFPKCKYNILLETWLAYNNK